MRESAGDDEEYILGRDLNDRAYVYQARDESGKSHAVSTHQMTQLANVRRHI